MRFAQKLIINIKHWTEKNLNMMATVPTFCYSKNNTVYIVSRKYLIYIT